jgi:5'-3' exonuclease
MAGLMLLDSASMYFRAFYGVKETMTAPDGTPVNAVRGFLDMISRLVRARHPDALVACLDYGWRPTFRVAAISTYKEHRANPDGSEQVPDDLTIQIPIITQVLAAAGVAMAGADDYEADDVMGTLATRADGPVEVVTGDRDLFQLVDDAQPITVVYIAKGVGNRETVDEADVARRYSIPGKLYADFATLRGDPSDGLPGVPGVGDKTAAAIISTFGGLDEVIAAAEAGADGFPRGSGAKVVAAREYLDQARKVVLVARDAEVGQYDAALPKTPRDPKALAELVQRWGLESSVGRIREALATASG